MTSVEKPRIRKGQVWQSKRTERSARVRDYRLVKDVAS